jgi:hypothetical protein
MWKQRFFKVVVFLLLVLLGSLPGYGQRTVIAVRHAHKIDNTDDAVLSPTGEAQANRLAHVLKEVGKSSEPVNPPRLWPIRSSSSCSHTSKRISMVS